MEESAAVLCASQPQYWYHLICRDSVSFDVGCPKEIQVLWRKVKIIYCWKGLMKFIFPNKYVFTRSL